MADIDPQLVAILAIVSTVLSLLLAAAVTVLALRLRVVRRTQRRVFGGVEVDVIDLLDRQSGEIAQLRQETTRLHTDTVALRDRLRAAVSRTAVIRYDAFDDMGGALSFSAALLDEHNSGVVISAINGRSETRCYAKPIVGGMSEHSLSIEETEAISAAIEGRPASVPTGGRRRRRAS